MQTTELIPVEIQTEIETELTAIMNGSSAIDKINTQPQYDNAVQLTREIKRVSNRLETQRKELVAPFNGHVKWINDWFKNPGARLLALEMDLKRALQEYQREQERIRLEAQRKADEAARKERERIEAQARAQREKEEAARRAEEEARRRAAEATNAAARAKAMAEAERAAKAAAAAAEKADTKEQIASMVVNPVVPTQAQKTAGMTTVTTYKAEIIDKVAFIRWCLDAGQMQYLTIEANMLDRVVAAAKGELLMPGVRCVKNESIRMRAA
jgi:membrane protein involved in colicin uptake